MTFPPPASLRIGLINLEWRNWSARRLPQAQALRTLELDVLCLLEVDGAIIAEFARECGYAWWRCSVPADIEPYHPAVAILGQPRVQPILGAEHQLSAEAFCEDGAPLDDGLARRYHEKHLAIDVETADVALRIGAFHAPAARTPYRGAQIGDRKPWFHARLARWVTTWTMSHVFAIDANTPKRDTLSWATTEMYWPTTGGRPGEELLVGGPGQALHDDHDLWREYLLSSAGAADLARVPDRGPLARSWRGYRYDQIWASRGLRASQMRYLDWGLSDHALVTATVELSAQGDARPAAPAT